MKVLFLTDQLHTTGGTEVYLKNLIVRLRARGVECWCFSGGQACAEPSRHLIEPRIVDALRVREAARVAADLEALLERERFDAVHMSNLHSAALTRIVARVPGAIRHLHDAVTICPDNKKYFRAARTACDIAPGAICLLKCMLPNLARGWNKRRWLTGYPEYRRNLDAARHVARFVVASHHMKRQHVLAGFDAERITVLPYFIDERRASPAPLPPGRTRAVFVGRAVAEKGIDLLIHAMARAPELDLTVVGDGPELAGLKALAHALGLDARVTFTGGVANAQARRLMAEGHFVVVPSVWPEPFGIVGIEAMACGRAAVGFDVGGITEWLEDGITGLAVRPGDVDALAAAMRRLARDRALLERLGEGAWRSAERFLVDAHLDRFMKLLEAARAPAAAGSP